MNKKKGMAMLLLLTSSVMGIFMDTTLFMKVLSGVIAALALSVLLGWLPFKKQK